jgi:hypothetical protein
VYGGAKHAHLLEYGHRAFVIARKWLCKGRQLLKAAKNIIRFERMSKFVTNLEN